MYARVWRAFPGSQLVLEGVITQGDKLACRSRGADPASPSGERGGWERGLALGGSARIRYTAASGPSGQPVAKSVNRSPPDGV